MKKKFYKIMSALITLVILISGLSLTALAADPEENDDADTPSTQSDTTEKAHTYELYQIFTGDYSNDILSNLKWGVNGTGYESGKVTAVDSKVTDDLKTVTESKSYSEKLAVITKYVNLKTTPYKTSADKDQPEKDTTPGAIGYTYKDIEPGYYLIKDKDGSQSGEKSFYTLYVVKSAGTTLYFEPKGSVPTVTKKVQEEDSEGNLGWYTNNSASIGEDVKYQLTGTVSSRISDFATYYYKFTDTLSKGLTFKMIEDANGKYYKLKNGTYTTTVPSGDDDAYASTTTKYSTGLKVFLVNDTETGTTKEEITQYFWVDIGNYDSTNGTNITVAIGDLKALLNVKASDATNAPAKYTLTGTSKIVVEYTAILNENALVKDPNTNEVKLIYSNDPNNSGKSTTTPPGTPSEDPKPGQTTGESEKSETHTYTTGLVITKVDGSDDSKILTGAEFTLTGSSVYQVIVTEQTVFEKADDGTYYRLNDGTYTDKEPISDGEGKNIDDYEDTTTKYKKTNKVTLKGTGLSETTVKGEVDENGKVTFTGLGAGTYTLTETKTPAGYNTIEPISFTISFDKDKTEFKSSYSAVALDPDTGMFASKVMNFKGSSLPHTGGIGTTIFYTLGSVLTLGAAVLLIVRKRMSRETN